MILDLAPFEKLLDIVPKLEAALERIETAPVDPGSPSRLLLTLDEACALMGIRRKTMYDHITNRRLPFVKLGLKVFFDPEDLKAWIGEFKVPAAVPLGKLKRRSAHRDSARTTSDRPTPV